MNDFDIIIIGSGPSGLMAASHIDNKSILIIESNPEIGGKIKVSGGGRCNVTNNKDVENFLSNVPKNSKFLYSTLYTFGPSQIIDFFQQNGTPLVEEKDNKMFPKSHNSQDIINTFKRVLNDKDVTIKTNTVATSVEFKNGKYIINEQYTAAKLIIATGGHTYRHLGTEGFGYEVAKEFGLKVTDLFAVEAPLVSNSELISSKAVQGVALQDVTATLLVKNKKIFSKKHDLLFTHFGLSGPLALQASFFASKALRSNKRPIIMRIDLNEEYIAAGNVPKRLLPFIVDNKIEVEIHDVRGAKHGFVTDGGVSLKEINPKTFEAKNQSGLYFIGEVLDVNAFTGGYNITNCLSEGYTLAAHLNDL
ncbi:aminoacetone oxidase family FAD-binding enzyme [Mollicutes bacterium LVI A0039]|nr:aminoacetone oxidase family FAD-binding enzyme [Mollicutes bacterium LVI A0039]